MAQSPTYFGLRRGSTKTQTFSILNGKQITKDRQIGGRNPQTPEQMRQRMVMATVSAVYARMKQIVDHSFEGVAYGGQTMAEFIRVNAAALRNALTETNPTFSYNYYRDRAMYPGTYVMSRGTATSLPTTEVRVGSGFFIEGATSDTGACVVYFVLEGEPSSWTADYVMSKLGVSLGDMATACFAYPLHNADGYGFSFVRFKFIQGGTTPLTAQNISEYIAIESPHPVTTQFTQYDIEFSVNIPDSESEFTLGHCLIHSLRTANGWSRSSESLIWPNDTDWTPMPEEALSSYPLGPSYVLNGGQV